MAGTQPEPLVSPLQLRPVVRGLRLLFGVVVAHGGFAALVFDRLPARIPVHFGVDGAADAWSAPGLGSWFLIVVVSAVLALAVAAGALAVFRIPPKWMNLPRKAEFLQLPEPERRAVLGVVAAFTLLLGAIVCLGLLAIHALVALAAFGLVATFPVAVPFAVIGAAFLVLIVMFIRVSAAVDRATARRVQHRR
jgi:uncharacterized membrane protein